MNNIIWIAPAIGIGLLAYKFMNSDRWIIASIILIPIAAITIFVHFLAGWEGVKVFFWVSACLIGFLLFVGLIEYIGDPSGKKRKTKGNEFISGYVIGRFLGR